MRHLLLTVLAACTALLAQEPTVAQLDRARTGVAKDARLTETEKKRILASYDDAIRSLQEAWRFRAAQAGHERRIEAVAKEVSALRAEMLRPAVYPLPPENPKEDSEAVAEVLDRAVTERGARSRALSDLSRTASDLAKRDDALVKRRNELAAAADSTDDQLTVALTSGSHVWEEAARVLAQCRRLAIQAELGAVNAERKALQIRRSALPVMRDAAKLRLEAVDRAIQILHGRSRAARDRNAARELASAKAIAEQAAAFSPGLQSAAFDVIETANHLWGPSGTIYLQQDIADVTAQIKLQTARVRDITAAIKRRYEAAGPFATSAEWLQYLPHDLPKAADIRAQRRSRLLSAVRLRREILALEDQRRTEPALETQVEALTVPSAGSAVDPQLQARARQILQLRRNVSEEILRTSEDLEGRLSEYDTASAELLGSLDDLKDFAMQRVLWSRSVADLPSLSRAGVAALWFLWNPDWKRVAGTLAGSLGLGVTGLVVLGFAGFLWLRRRHILQVSWKPGESPTRTLIRTAVWSAVLPAILLWIASLVRSSEGPALGNALATGLSASAWLLFPLMFLTSATADGGMMQRHFGWSNELRNMVRRELKWLRVALPLAWFFVAALAEVGGLFSDDPFLQAGNSSLGRFAFMAAMGMVLFAGIRLLEPGQPVAVRIRERQRRGLRVQLLANRGILALVVFLFFVLAAAGFFTTARVLARNTFLTVCLTGTLIIAASLMMRWRENRERELAAKAPSGRPGRDEAQVRQLGRFAITVIWALIALTIWSDIFPALTMLDRVEILSASAAPQAATQPAGVPAQVSAAMPKPAAAQPAGRSSALTLLDVLEAALAAIVTVILVKNVPGLLNFTVLDRFHLDSGAAYAAGAIIRYVVILMGLGVVSAYLGIQWMQVQWLVAALTFGIGFGLQEIFANFASGLILLFDRSIRVGDAVSVGDFSGRVVDIRMRATTVALWDRSEMIVPNKEFITAKLINWTLSHPETRVDLKIGIAYCSDVELVRKLLFDIATANPNVLKKPAPDVFLTAFGSSSIDFQVQAYGLFDYGRPKLIDELYRAIYQEFGRHGISIAFPQLDVHVRTVPSEIRSSALGTAG